MWKDVLSRHLFGVTDEYHKNPHENWRSFWDLNREPSEPISRAATAGSFSSFWNCVW
jgi:hypothetical protein